MQVALKMSAHHESIRGEVCLAKLKALRLKIMSNLTHLRKFPWTFTEIHIQSNHIIKTYGCNAPSFIDRAKSC